MEMIHKNIVAADRQKLTKFYLNLILDKQFGNTVFQNREICVVYDRQVSLEVAVGAPSHRQ